jgi:hypothetical protein
MHPSESFFKDARCTQSAAGFALLIPQQQRSNNPNGYFNWFQSGDIERGAVRRYRFDKW